MSVKTYPEYAAAIGVIALIYCAIFVFMQLKDTDGSDPSYTNVFSYVLVILTLAIVIGYISIAWQFIYGVNDELRVASDMQASCSQPLERETTRRKMIELATSAEVSKAYRILNILVVASYIGIALVIALTVYQNLGELEGWKTFMFPSQGKFKDTLPILGYLAVIILSILFSIIIMLPLILITLLGEKTMFVPIIATLTLVHSHVVDCYQRLQMYTAIENKSYNEVRTPIAAQINAMRST